MSTTHLSVVVAENANERVSGALSFGKPGYNALLAMDGNGNIALGKLAANVLLTHVKVIVVFCTSVTTTSLGVKGNSLATFFPNLPVKAPIFLAILSASRGF